MPKNTEDSVTVILGWGPFCYFANLESQILNILSKVGSKFCISHHDNGILLEIWKEP